MSRRAEFDRAGKEAQEPSLYEGTVLKTPTSESHRLLVRIPAYGFQRGKEGIPCLWQPRYVVGSDTVDVLMPDRGDLVFVAFSDGPSDRPAEPVVVCHWPFD